DALCLCRAGAVDLCGVAGLRVRQGFAGVRDTRRADPLRQRQLCAGADPQARLEAGHDRRDVADAPALDRVCRGQDRRPARRAGDQPALPVARHRPPRRDRRVARGAAAVPRPGAGALSRRRNPAGHRARKRRRAPALRARDRLDRVPRDLHLQDGPGPDGGRRRPASRARARRAQGHRRLGDAGRHLDQHQRADDHDRREGRGDDPGGGAGEAGGVGAMPLTPALSPPTGPTGRGRDPHGGRKRAMQADYVIVGGGSAGCVLANRLTEDPSVKVLLIEAGGRDWHPYIHIPAGYMKLLEHKQLTWGFKAEADPGTNGRAITYPRGRVLGGSSSINGLIYIRSQPEDYDHWAQLGNRGWGWDDVLPYFKKAERWTG